MLSSQLRDQVVRLYNLQKQSDFYNNNGDIAIYL